MAKIFVTYESETQREQASLATLNLLLNCRSTNVSRGIIAKLVQLRRGIDSQPSGALECVFLNTEQFTQVGNSQPIIAVGLRGARRKVPRGRSSEGLGGGGLVSRGRDIVSGALCPLTSPL